MVDALVELAHLVDPETTTALRALEVELALLGPRGEDVADAVQNYLNHITATAYSAGYTACQFADGSAANG